MSRTPANSKPDRRNCASLREFREAVRELTSRSRRRYF
jgi:hypothetical protein